MSKLRKNDTETLDQIFDLIFIDLEWAWQAANALMKSQNERKLNYVSAKTQLAIFIIATSIRSPSRNLIDTSSLLDFFEKKGYTEDATMLRLYLIRYEWSNGNYQKAREMDKEFEEKYGNTISLKQQIHHNIFSVNFYMRDYDKTGQLQLMLRTEAQLRSMTEQDDWYRVHLSRVLQYKAEALVHTEQTEKLQEAINESVSLIEEMTETSDSSIFSAYYFKASIDAIAWRVDEALDVYYMLERRFEHKPFYHYLLIYVYLQIFKLLNHKFENSSISHEEKDTLMAQQLRYISLATSLPVANDWPYILGYLYLSRARLMRVMTRYEEAISNLAKALRIFTRVQDKAHIIDIYEEAHHSYKAAAQLNGDIRLYQKSLQAMENAYSLTVRHNQVEGKEKMDAMISKYELQQKELTEKILRQKVDALNKEIHLSALNLHDKLMVLDELKVYITSLQKKGQETNKLIHTIAKKIDSVIITEQDKSTLQQKMDEGNAAFYQIMAEKYPNLSTLEIHICGLLKTGMTNKELSKLYGQSEKSYEQHRYRIKKKIGLGAKEKLTKFLVAVSMENVNL